MTEGTIEATETYAIPNHELIKSIGSGSYGEVWLGRSVTGTYRGVKIVSRKNFKDPGPFDREFQGLVNFEGISLTHPGLVKLLHIGRSEANDYFFYIMELADDVGGGQEIQPKTYVPRTLRSEIVRQERIQHIESVSYGIDMAAALAHLQRHGLTHQDVKPSNVIFVQGILKFADVGLVSKIGEPGPDSFTLGYVPPEGPGGVTADIYALGRVLYEMRTGCTQDRFPELPVEMLDSEEGDDLLALNRIITRCCAAEARKRYQDASKLYSDLVRLKEACGLERVRTSKASNGPATCKTPGPPAGPKRVWLVSPELAEGGATFKEYLEEKLRERGFHLVVGEPSSTQESWGKQLEENLREADAVVVLLSSEALQSEMLAFDVELAEEVALKKDGPLRILPVRMNFTGPLPEPLGRVLDDRTNLYWKDAKDNERILEDLIHAMHAQTLETPPFTPPKLEAIGGAVPLDSKYYIDRPEDEQFQDAITRKDGIVLVKGARQVGKTSLLARGLAHARGIGATVALTDYQKLNTTDLVSVNSFYIKLGGILAEKLQLDVFPEDVWEDRSGPNMNFERYVRRHVLSRVEGHLVWGMDEVDRLFGCPFSSEVFSLFRAWYNERALDPTGPWSQLTLAIGYATEAHLFITDVNQSPFNVGTRLRLEDFSLEQVRDLNQRYGSPLKSEEELQAFQELLGGQPYLVRQALNEMAEGKTSFQEVQRKGDCDEGIFRDHLRRILVLLDRDEGLCEVVRKILKGEEVPDGNSFYRLRSAGLMSGDSPDQVQPRCLIYKTYLRRHLL